jgi:hypothetical protein
MLLRGAEASLIVWRLFREYSTALSNYSESLQLYNLDAISMIINASALRWRRIVAADSSAQVVPAGKIKISI